MVKEKLKSPIEKIQTKENEQSQKEGKSNRLKP
jgi:hypothetical protein